MPYNGSGLFVRAHDWTDDADAAINIRADRMDEEFDGIATALSGVITKDGQTTITANLPMSTFRHTGVGNAVARTDYAAMGQVQDGKINWVDGGGTADAITATYSPAITALVDGQLCHVRATAANATTTPTFAPNGLTARTIVKQGGQALAAGDIRADGHELILRYDLTNTRWELLNPKSPTTLPSSGIIGTTTNDSAAAGIIGEYISSSVANSTVSMNSGINYDLTSISLTAGDWDVEGNIAIAVGAGATVSVFRGWISTTSATFPTPPNSGAMFDLVFGSAVMANPTQAMPVGKIRLSLSGTTTVYLSSRTSSSGGTVTGGGFIGARRVR